MITKLFHSYSVNYLHRNRIFAIMIDILDCSVLLWCRGLAGRGQAVGSQTRFGTGILSRSAASAISPPNAAAAKSCAVDS
jgi:hypothetical protein